MVVVEASVNEGKFFTRESGTVQNGDRDECIVSQKQSALVLNGVTGRESINY